MKQIIIRKTRTANFTSFRKRGIKLLMTILRFEVRKKQVSFVQKVFILQLSYLSRNI